MRITVRAAYSSHDNLVFTVLSIAFSLSIWNFFLLPLAPSFLRACQSLRQPPSWISNRSCLSSCRYCCPSDRPFFSFFKHFFNLLSQIRGLPLCFWCIYRKWPAFSHFFSPCPVKFQTVVTSIQTPDTAANGHGSHGMIPRTQTGRERGITSQDFVYIKCLATLFVFVCAWFHDFLLLWLKH